MATEASIRLWPDVRTVRPDESMAAIGRVRHPAAHDRRPAVAFIRGDANEQYSLRFFRLEPYVIPKRSLTGDNRERADAGVLQAMHQIDEIGRKPIFVGLQMDVFVKLGPRPPGHRSRESSP